MEQGSLRRKAPTRSRRQEMSALERVLAADDPQAESARAFSGAAH